MQTRNDVLAVFHRKRGHAVHGHVNTVVRAKHLPHAQQIGFEIKRIELRVQVVAQKVNAEQVSVREPRRRKFLQLIEPLLQMRPPQVAPLLRQVRPPVVILMTSHIGRKFRLILQPLFEVVGKEPR